MPPETKKRVNLMNQGEGRGQAVPLSRSQLEDAGLDPDADLEANRYVFEDDGTIRIRLYEQEDDA